VREGEKLCQDKKKMQSERYSEAVKIILLVRGSLILFDVLFEKYKSKEKTTKGV